MILTFEVLFLTSQGYGVLSHGSGMTCHFHYLVALSASLETTSNGWILFSHPWTISIRVSKEELHVLKNNSMHGCHLWRNGLHEGHVFLSLFPCTHKIRSTTIVVATIYLLHSEEDSSQFWMVDKMELDFCVCNRFLTISWLDLPFPGISWLWFMPWSTFWHPVVSSIVIIMQGILVSFAEC